MTTYSDACQAARQALRDAGLTPAQASAVCGSLEALIEQALETKFAVVATAAQQPAGSSQ
jgi:hypothetical protein